MFQADAPDVGKIPVQDATGVTVVLLTCGYRNQEFIRVGYYVNNEYGDPELKENPPSNPDFDKVSACEMSDSSLMPTDEMLSECSTRCESKDGRVHATEIKYDITRVNKLWYR